MVHSFLFSNRILLLCAILFQSLLFSGCGYISLARKTEFVPTTEDVTISIADNEDGPFEEITSKKTKIKLNHFHKGYFVKQEKVGHITKIEEIARTSKNNLKRLDIALLLPTGIVATTFLPVHFFLAPNMSQTPNILQTTALFGALGIGVLGWGAVIPCPGTLYAKKIDLPRLIPILTKDTNQLFLTANKHDFNLRKRGVKVRDYPTMKQYNNGYGYETRDTAEAFEFIEELDLYDEVSEALVNADYGIDSTEATNTTTLKINSLIRSVTYVLTDNKLKCELKTSWAIETNDELQYLYDRSFSSESEWHDFIEDSLEESQQHETIHSSLTEAMESSLNLFLGLDTIQSILSSPVPIPLLEEEEMELLTGTSFCSSVSEAVKAVVTVVTNKGHGSGCIITPDGYILTNAHVVEDDTTELKAIFSDDVENEIPLKFVRMNEAVDLALLKIDSTGFVPLPLGVNADIETGADVYAIGTPADLDLGQTVTRGIISGKRKFGGHSRIQTDVGISPGNSGGALILTNGILLGIVTSEMKSRKIDDIGFAIPAPIIESALKIKLSK